MVYLPTPFKESVSEQEKLAQEISFRQIATHLFSRYTEISNPFTFAPDVSSQEFHVAGYQEIHNLAVSLPVGSQGESVLFAFVHITPAGRRVTLHLFDEPLETFKAHPQLADASTYTGLSGNALFDLRRQQKQNPHLTTFQTLSWQSNDPFISQEFTSTSFNTPATFDTNAQLLEQAKLAIAQNRETPLQYQPSREPIMERD